MKLYYINTERIEPKNLFLLEGFAEEHRKLRIEKAKSISQRNEHIGADALLKIAALDDFGAFPSEMKSGYTEKGEPFVFGTDKHISISHSNGCVLLAVSDGRVGADIEFLRLVDMIGLSRRYFTEDEKKVLSSSSDRMRAFFGIWTAKEAYFKYSNERFASPLSVDTSIEKAPVTLECDGCIIAAVGDDSYEFFEVTNNDIKALLALM